MDIHITPRQIKVLKVALLVGNQLCWVVALRFVYKTAVFLGREYSTLYQFETLLASKVFEHAPEIFEDPEVQEFMINVQFNQMMENL